MSAVLAAARLDARTVQPYSRQLLWLLGAVGTIGLLTGPPVVVVVSGSLFVSLMASYPFAIADKNDLGTLYASLPVRRGALVAGRYVVTGLLWCAMTVVTAVLALVVSHVRHEPLEVGELGLVVGAGALLFAVLTGLQLPVYYALGYTRGRMVAYVPLILLGSGVAAAGSLLGERATHWLGTVPQPPAGLLLLGAGVLLGVSGLVSWRMDLRRSVAAG